VLCVRMRLGVGGFSGGEWAKLGVRTGGAPVRGKGKRPVHRPQSAPLHRKADALTAHAAAHAGAFFEASSLVRTLVCVGG
jgi:hypothetical protein